jgi:uncharacterized membrane protein YphA (DoxX/SURF4 family)
MENLFPALLTYSFFAPTVLRIFVALLFMSDAKKYWKAHDRWWLADGIALVIGVFIFVGYATQLFALFGIGYLAFVYLKRDRDSVFLDRYASFLALAILVSLLLTGAGALAFDLPF